MDAIEKELYALDGDTDDVLIYNCIIKSMINIRNEVFIYQEGDIKYLNDEIEKIIHLLKSLEINYKAIGDSDDE